MDPLSITTGVLVLIGRVVTAVETCQSYVAKYKMAEISMTTMRAECASIEIALRQFTRLLAQGAGRGTGSTQEGLVLERYILVVNACSDTFTVLDQSLAESGIGKLKKEIEETASSRIRFMWNGSQMVLVRQEIHSLSVALTLLLTVFTSENAANIYRIMNSRQSREIFSDVSSGAASIRQSRREGRNADDRQSSTCSTNGDEEFAFDDLIVNATAYRRVFARAKSKMDLLEGEDAEAHTIVPDSSARTKTGKEEPTKPSHVEMEVGRTNSHGRSVSESESEPQAKDVKVKTTERPHLLHLWKRKGRPGLEATAPLSADSVSKGVTRPWLFKSTRFGSSSPHNKPGPRTAPSASSGHEVNIRVPSLGLSPVLGVATNPMSIKTSYDGVAFGQSEQLPFFKDYYSNDDIHPGDVVSVLWAYVPHAGDEFELERGDMLKVIGIWDDGWATGVRINGRAEAWDSTRAKQEDAEKEYEDSPTGEIKAFCLVCVCLPEAWATEVAGDTTVKRA